MTGGFENSHNKCDYPYHLVLLGWGLLRWGENYFAPEYHVIGDYCPSLPLRNKKL